MIPELDLPVLAEAEVAVAGAGPAGVAAALAAARSGARVVLLEQTGCCGGMATSGLVPVFIHISDRVHRVASGICYELVSEMCRRMEVPAVDEIWQHIHPEVLKRVCDDKLAEAGVELLLAVKVADVIRSGGRIDALAVATSRGLKKVTASIFVDATGDGLVAAAASVPFELGDEAGRTMSPSLCVQYSNINLDRMREAERRGEGAGQLWFRYRDEIPLDEYHIVGVSEYGSGSGSGAGTTGISGSAGVSTVSCGGSGGSSAFGNAAQPAAKQSGSRIHTAQSKHFQYVIYTPPFHSSGSQLFFSVYRGGISSAVTGPASGTAPAVCRSKPR